MTKGGFKSLGWGKKSDLTSEFNMGADYLRFLCNDIMTEVAIRSVEARDKPRMKLVRKYYSIVRELYNQSEAVWSHSESKHVENILNQIDKSIEKNEPMVSIIHKIEFAQRVIYNLIRKYNMLIPIMVNPNTEEEKLRLLRTAFGLYGKGVKLGETSEDNETKS
jgi:hypothetical protein